MGEKQVKAIARLHSHLSTSSASAGGSFPRSGKTADPGSQRGRTWMAGLCMVSQDPYPLSFVVLKVIRNNDILPRLE